MKKLFALLLALSCLFLTACNNNPADSTTGMGTGTDNSQNTGTVNELELKETIVYNRTIDFIDLPSRVIYGNRGKIYYYSKVDGKAYVYCFDPLCKHDEGDCFAEPWNSMETIGFDLEKTFFINNRFYGHTGYGQIVSFSFDGTDKKIEYDAEYDLSAISGNPWGHCIAVGPYIYIDLRSFGSEDGKAHTLRFNAETGEMEDLTEKTGIYMYPSFFYDGMLYGYDEGVGYLKADPDLKACEEIERIQFSDCYLGSCFINIMKDQDGIGYTYFYDMKTETTETYEIQGLQNVNFRDLYADENYIYFYLYDKIEIGQVEFRGELKPTYKYNDGSIYRVNHDGTGIVCIYEETDFNITGQEAIIIGDQFLIMGQNLRVHDNQVETWDSGLLVGTIGADGKIDSLDPVEVVE